MKIHTIGTLFCAAFLAVLQMACVVTSSQGPTTRSESSLAPQTENRPNTKGRFGPHISNKGQISREEAISVAEADAVQNYQSEHLKVVVCELARLWVVIYDSGGPEYYIGKNSGAILSVWQWPRALQPSAKHTGSSGNNGISKSKAIEIAKTHFADLLLSYGDASEDIYEHDAVACELSNSWRVFFEYRASPSQSLATLPNSNPPNYIIDKGTGRIIYTTHEIAP